MACPYFYPETKCDGKLSASLPQFPLGDAYVGRCRAETGEFQPDLQTLTESCNMGYARRRCVRFPRDAGPDAVRFTIVRDRDGGIALYYVIEKNHAPYEHGPIEYNCETGELRFTHGNAAIVKQARAYVESYLRRARPQAATA